MRDNRKAKRSSHRAGITNNSARRRRPSSPVRFVSYGRLVACCVIIIGAYGVGSYLPTEWRDDMAITMMAAYGVVIVWLFWPFNERRT